MQGNISINNFEFPSGYISAKMDILSNISFMNESMHTTVLPRPSLFLRSLGMILLAAVLIVAMVRDRIVNQNQWQIQVTGQGKVAYQPDIAKVTMGVRIDKAATAEEAIKQLNDKMNQVIKLVSETGIKNDNFQTQTYSLSAHYNQVYDEALQTTNSQETGYNASQLLTVSVNTTENNDMVAKVLSAGTKGGVNEIQGITFESSKIEELKHQARLEAIQDARSKSDEMSKTLGVRLGKVVGWWENSIFNPVPMFGSMDGKGGGGGEPNVPTGTQEVVIEVNISYLVK